MDIICTIPAAHVGMFGVDSPYPWGFFAQRHVYHLTRFARISKNQK
jgi:hypothetical protein